MRTLLRLGLLAAGLATLPVAVPVSAGAGGKTHVGVKANQVVSLSTSLIPNDNSQGHPFRYDRGPVPFAVPAGFAFVVTDIVVEPNAGTLSAADRIFVLIDAGDRFFSMDYLGGGTRHYPLAGGIVVPAGETLSGRNTTFSTHGVDVRILGYFVKGAGLPFGESPFGEAP
jgi:hypothetical protein